MIFREPPTSPDALFDRLAEYYRADETQVVNELIGAAQLPRDSLERIAVRARKLVSQVRETRLGKGGLDAFLHEYGLSSEEGVVLMCLAESLLRIPDAETADRLIRDKLGDAGWEQHLGHSNSLFVNASTWALMLTGSLVTLRDYQGQSMGSVFGRLVSRLGEPVIRQSVTQGMRIIGRQFVMGRSIDEALQRAGEDDHARYRFSFDMLGEAAHTQADADRYFRAYQLAIQRIGESSSQLGPIQGPGISVKLSALHPRYECSQRLRVLRELRPKLAELAVQAKNLDIGLNIDAEEADRLELSLEIIRSVCADSRLTDWSGLGLAVQAYQKRALPLLDWLSDLTRRYNRKLMVRLVKGAYWDTEIKLSQEKGLKGYPVFTRKAATDVSYIACAKRLLAEPECFYPQFATHNAHTISVVLELAGGHRNFEFQRLHGMGEVLYEQLIGDQNEHLACRIYAPVGSHEDLLAYLVRRLLENGANSSFVNRIVDERFPLERIIADPVEKIRRIENKPHPRIPTPSQLYGGQRKNSAGIDTCNTHELVMLAERMTAAEAQHWEAHPIIGGVPQTGDATQVKDPSNHGHVIGSWVNATTWSIDGAFRRAQSAQSSWDEAPASERAACLERTAELLERDMPELMTVAVREAGKTIVDGIAEVREAVDFCRYYAARCRIDFGQPLELPGPTGESNRLSLHGRGVFVCISPWNFPLAIFTGQISAALAAGNAVIAKPAEQTPLIATRAIQLFHEAGIPSDVLHLLPGDGPTLGAALVADGRIAGVAFTGSTDTARLIYRTLAAKSGPIVPLIAETGGQNAMLVDSSALPEQVVVDVLASAFQSAGQRCSALRVLYVQNDIADKLLRMLAGAMRELIIGDPGLLETDVGPVIDHGALDILNKHAEFLNRHGQNIYTCSLPANCDRGTFFAPRAFEIESIDLLKREVFGPILHVVRYEANRLDNVIDAINSKGYGLTLGV
ncbi:MAG: bifunctional proline dehydrogenase/L-glutamate gamma-semialdehyde dehydrogenase PutA, partial [Gammaproteobacteria bacterium]|nr:bifunctional proline dehydrogenase/L-glutamate gamma-semialdehyde dehydrogenase PutA [Gammaproteobacteria bacterium]